MDEETDLGGESPAFRTTLWSVVLRAGRGEDAQRRLALETLVRIYWKPVYGFLRRRGRPVEDAKDLTQGFFATLLDREFLRSVERGRGKFRTFLLTALENHLTDAHRRSTAEKRGGGRLRLPLDFEAAESELAAQAASPEPAEAQFLREWAVRILSRAVGELRAEYGRSGRLREFDLFRDHLARGDAGTYADMARALGVDESDVRNRVHATRVRLREAILDELRGCTETEQEAREELGDLFAAFG